ncbi:MAG: hypothetical protein J6X16_01005 [Bacteroidales bacterium]|nr:hypothetical protein [Bacteroidales bacterium]
MAVVYAQTDTEFWFAPPDLEQTHQQVPIQFCFTTYSEESTVILEQPANSGFTPVSFTIPANSFYVYDVSSLVDTMETKPANTVVNKGVHIYSTTPISCYYESVGNNSEIYTLKGRNALGTDFLVPMQTEYINYYSTSPSSIEIVATEDNTVVQITAPVALRGGIPAGSTITITLNRGQSYSIWANGTEGVEHLHNTIIHSNKPIAVNTTDDSIFVPVHADLVGEQIVPISMLGTRYIALRNNSGYERVFVFPVENQTTVSINGVAQQVLNTGQWLNYALSSSSVAYLIESDKPVVVFQLTAIDGEMGGTMLPQIECTGSNKVSHLRPNTSTEIVSLVVATECISDFELNGNPNIISAADFSPIPLDSSWSYCVKNVSSYVPVNTVMTLRNNAGRFQMGIFDGESGNGGSNGYYSDYSSASYVRFEMDSLVCIGGDIVIQYSAPNVSNVVLTTPNGQQLTTPPFVFSHVDTSISGLYQITGIDTSSCFNSYSDYISIQVVPCAGDVTITATSDTICVGEVATLQAETDAEPQFEPSVPSYPFPTVVAGDILCTDNSIVKASNWPVAGKTAKAIVFYVDNTGEHGWAVHLQDQSTGVVWGEYGTDISTLTNYANSRSALTDFNGYINTQRARAAGTSAMYPAVYMADFANGWYIPAAGQLRTLFSELLAVNASLQLVGGTQFPMGSNWWYWSSTERNQSFMWYVTNAGIVSYNLKDYTARVRVIRTF